MMKLILILLCLTQAIFAGESGRVGNGGGVLFCEKKEPVLLDIYESQFYEIHTFENLKSISLSERKKLLESRVSSFSPAFHALFRDLRKHFYKKVNFLDVSSFKIPDDFNNLFYESSCELKVVAVQRKPLLAFDNIFFINKVLWEKSGEFTQEGLIDHELLYLIALIRGAENSKQAREFLAFLLSDSFLTSSAKDAEVMFIKNILRKGYVDNIDDQDRERFYTDVCESLKNSYFFKCPEYVR